MQLEEIRALVTEDLQRVDQTIVQRLASDIVLGQSSLPVHHWRGRQAAAPAEAWCWRPCLRPPGPETRPGRRHHRFIHTATLLHDDVVDGSNLRRRPQHGQPRLRQRGGVLVGDYLYSARSR